MREHQAGRSGTDDSDLRMFHYDARMIFDRCGSVVRRCRIDSIWFFSATRFSVRHAPLSRVGRAYCRKDERHKCELKWRASGKQHPHRRAIYVFQCDALRCRASGERFASKANGVRSRRAAPAGEAL